uniref:Uncharacterized protein n=1 Tax=Siphoviridae sp. ctEEM24 TaxID=2826203 RepID=A0A8S5LYL9_9CAUD|nr:MAG TPA: hypothetical protein [Siphoviridae sp. ctEEM24]
MAFLNFSENFIALLLTFCYYVAALYCIPWELVLPVGLFLFIDFLLLYSYSGYTGHCHARVF